MRGSRGKQAAALGLGYVKTQLARMSCSGTCTEWLLERRVEEFPGETGRKSGRVIPGSETHAALAGVTGENAVWLSGKFVQLTTSAIAGAQESDC